MKIEALIPHPDKRVEFSYQKAKFVPVQPGCYVLTNFLNDIVYIGLSKNLNRRIQDHLDNKDKRQITTRGVAYWFHYLLVNNENKLTSVERGWLNQYELTCGELPLLNKVHSPL